MHWVLLTKALSVALLIMAGIMFLVYRNFQKMREQAANAVRLIDNLSEGVYRSSIEGKQLSANRALVRLNGYASEREMLAAVSSIEKEWYVEPNRRSEFKQILTRDGYVLDFISEIRRHKNGERIWISENARLVIDPKTGVPLYYEGTVRDISESVRKRQAEARLNKLADMTPGGLFQLRRETDGSYSVPFMSQPFMAMVGITSSDSQAFGRPLLPGIDDADYPDYIKSLSESYETLKPWSCVFRHRRDSSESLQWLEIKALPERADDGAIEWYGCMADISEHKELVQRIERMAYFDPLTDLPNRRLLLNRISEATKISGRRRRHGALLFIDLDGFKAINDTYGHATGDDYISKIARCLEGNIRDSDTVARLGGDEFVILLHDLDFEGDKAKHDASIVVTKLMTALRRGVDINGVVQSVNCSIGVTVFKGGAESAETLIRNADKAMYRAKAAGRNRFLVYDTPEEIMPVLQKGAA